MNDQEAKRGVRGKLLHARSHCLLGFLGKGSPSPAKLFDGGTVSEKIGLLSRQQVDSSSRTMAGIDSRDVGQQRFRPFEVREPVQNAPSAT